MGSRNECVASGNDRTKTAAEIFKEQPLLRRLQHFRLTSRETVQTFPTPESEHGHSWAKKTRERTEAWIRTVCFSHYLAWFAVQNYFSTRRAPTPRLVVAARLS